MLGVLETVICPQRHWHFCHRDAAKLLLHQYQSVIMSKTCKQTINIQDISVQESRSKWSAISEYGIVFLVTTGRIFFCPDDSSCASFLSQAYPHSPSELLPLPLSLPPSMRSRCIMKKANTIIFDFPFALAVHLAHPSLPRPSWLRANEKAVLSVALSLYPLRIIRREQFWCL